MADPKVTVAVPTRNRPQLLRLAIESILAQAGVELDVIVLDNASTDDTPDVVRAICARDARVEYVRSEVDLGIVRNWNRGIQLAAARSPFVCIFHDDDIMLPGFLAESCRALEAHPSAGMSLCVAQYIRPDGSPKGLIRTGDVEEGLNRGADFLELTIEGRGIEIPPAIVVLRADALRRAGVVDSPHTRGTMDMNLYMRMAAIADVAFIPKVLSHYRLHEGSDTELLNRTAGGTFWYGTMAERVDAVAYLLRSERAANPQYRQWLADRLLALHAHQSTAIHAGIPQMYHSWDNCRAIALEDLDRVLPPGETFIVIDDQQLGLGTPFGGRRVIPFLERNGTYWGAPDDDAQAIENLERLRSQGTRWLAIAWTSFWWLDQFGRFRQHLERVGSRRASSPHLYVYELSS